MSKYPIDPIMDEISGLVVSRDSNLLWILDSGNPASIYRTDLQGKLLKISPFTDAINIDWEALTQDNQANFYIADIGNNRHKRKQFTIYKIGYDLTQIDQIIFEYPNEIEGLEKTPDAESLVWYEGKLWLFTKNNSGAKNPLSNWYSIPDRPGRFEATIEGQVYFKKRVPTDVAISPSGTEIAWISYRYRKILGFLPLSSGSIFILPVSCLNGGQISYPKRMRIPGFRSGLQYESLGYLNEDTLLIGNERTAIDRPHLRYLKIKRD
ncbi:MAG: hypothetical protein ABIV51_11805 [Saprospiraceae bacterium]